MEILSKRLRERAEQLGISNAEAARRIGLEERRYAHYVAGRREPDLATLLKIARTLGATPDWLLAFDTSSQSEPERAALLARFQNASTAMSLEQLEMTVIQAEAISAKNAGEAK